MAMKTKITETSVAALPGRLQQVIIPDLRDFEEKGWKSYDRIRPKLEKKYFGKIVAIEVESEDYFIGDSLHEAGQQANEKRPGKLLFYTRIGGDPVWRLNGRRRSLVVERF